MRATQATGPRGHRNRAPAPVSSRQGRALWHSGPGWHALRDPPGTPGGDGRRPARKGPGPSEGATPQGPAHLRVPVSNAVAAPLQHAPEACPNRDPSGEGFRHAASVRLSAYHRGAAGFHGWTGRAATASAPPHTRRGAAVRRGRSLSRLTRTRAGTSIRPLVDRRRLPLLRSDDRTTRRTRALAQARIETHTDLQWWRTGIVRPPTGPA